MSALTSYENAELNQRKRESILQDKEIKSYIMSFGNDFLINEDISPEDNQDTLRDFAEHIIYRMMELKNEL